MATEAELLVGLQAVWAARNRLGEVKAKLEEFERVSLELQQLRLDVATAAREKEAAEESLRADALDVFERTGEKKLVGGIGIREGKKLVVLNQDMLAKWVRENGKVFLSVDMEAFEKWAKTADASQLPDCVTVESVAKATLPTVIKAGDLDVYAE